MTKKEAIEIAKTVTNDQLEEMFVEVMKHYGEYSLWGETAKVNKGMTKGTAWNIFGKDFNPDLKYSNIAKCNMVREFGDCLPDNVRIKYPPKSDIIINVVHQEPDFDKWT
jgi:hypothetical protein